MAAVTSDPALVHRCLAIVKERMASPDAVEAEWSVVADQIRRLASELGAGPSESGNPYPSAPQPVSSVRSRFAQARSSTQRRKRSGRR